MTASHSLVSVIVPMFNAENYISLALQSILQERQIPIEVIVINDRSTDHSFDRVREFRDPRIRVVDGEGRGAAHAMNVGFADARGEILMFCDSDDVFPEGRIRRQAQWLQDNSNFDGVCGIFSTIDAKGSLIAEMQTGNAAADITDELMRGKMRTSFCTYAIRSTLARKVGNFREFFEAGYDLDFQLRLGEGGRIAYIPENFYFYRLHETSITHTQPNALRKFFERTAIEFQRQRQTSGADDLERGNPPQKPLDGQVKVYSATDHIQEQLVSRAWREHRGGQKMSALRTGVRALLVNPLNARAWKSVLALIVK